MYDHQPYLFLPVDRPMAEMEAESAALSVVCGPTCDGVDIMGQNIPLPAGLEIGEYLFSPDIGAYSMVAATQFNGFDQAPVLFASQLAREVLTHTAPGEQEIATLPLAI